MAELNFIIRADNSDFIRKTEDIKKQISEASALSEKNKIEIGIDTSKAEGKAEELKKSLHDILASVPRIKADDIIKNGTFEDIQRGLKQTATVIRSNEAAIASFEDSLKELKRLQGEAFEAGDSKSLAHYQSMENALRGVISVSKKALEEAKQYDNELEQLGQKILETAKAEAQSAEATKRKEQSAQSLRAQIKELEKEAAELAQAYAEEGKKIDTNNPKYKELIEKIGQLRDLQGDIKTAGSIFANDEAQFQGIISGLSGVAGAASAAQGAVGLLAGENEHLQHIMLKVQSLMSITIGLQQVQQALNKDSAFSLVTLNSLREWWNRLLVAGRNAQVADSTAKVADTAAQTAQTAAATAGTAANIGLAGAFRMVGAAIKSIPVIGWIIAGISALIAVITHFTSKASEAKKKAEEFYKAVADNAAQPIVKIQELSAQWDALGDNMAAKEKFIRDNKSAFDQLRIAVNSVLDAEKALTEHKEAFIQAQISKAKAAATVVQAQDKIKDLLEAQQKEDAEVARLEAERSAQLTALANTPKVLVSDKAKAENNINAYYDKLIEKAQEKSNKLNTEISDMFTKAAGYETEGYKTLKEAGIEGTRDYEEGTVGALEQTIQTKQEALKKLSDPEEYKKASKEIEDLQKEVERITGKKSSSTKTEESTAKKAEQEQKKQEEARQKLAKTMEQLEEANNVRRLQTMDNGHKKRMAELDKEFKDELDKIQKQAKELAEANKKAGITDVNDKGLTLEQQGLIEEATALAQKNHAKMLETEIKNEAQYMLDYLKEYGSFQQQKLAIAEEYAEKIRKAEESGANEWQIKSLENERDSAVQQIDNKALATDIDWHLVLTGFTTGFEDEMRNTLSKLKNYINTPEFTGQTPENKQIIFDAMQRIEDALPEGKGTLNIGELNKMLDTLAVKLENTQQAAQRHNDAVAAVADAQKAYNKALEEGDETLQAITKAELDAALTNAEDTRVVYENLKTETENYSQQVKTAFKDSVSAVEGFASGLSQLNSGSMRGAYEGLKKSVSSLQKIDMGEEMNKAIAKFSEALDSLPILGGILDLLDVLKEGIGTLISGLIDTIFDSVNGLLENLLSGKFIEQIGTSLYKGVGTLLDTVSFGLLSHFFSGSSDKTLERDIELLTASNEALKKSIDAMNDELEKASTVESFDIVKQQQKNLEESMRNTKEMMQRSAAAYSNGFLGIGGDKSSNTDINRAMSAEEWKRVSQAAGTAVKSAQDFFNLSSEQMWNVMRNAPDLYAKIKDYADNGYKDAAQFMDDYIGYWEEINSLWDAWREKVTATSFDSIKSEFSSMLSSLESDTETFGDKFGDTIRNALIKSMMDTQFNKRLEQWYKNFADAMGDDGDLSKSELEKLRAEYEGITNDALQWRNNLFNALGLDKDESKLDANKQQATAGYSTSISEDTGTEIVGRMTAQYLLIDSILSVNSDLLSNTQNIIEQMRQDYNIREALNNNVAEIKDYQGLIYNIMESILKNTKNLESMDARLDKIERNTREL